LAHEFATEPFVCFADVMILSGPPGFSRQQIMWAIPSVRISPRQTPATSRSRLLTTPLDIVTPYRDLSCRKTFGTALPIQASSLTSEGEIYVRHAHFLNLSLPFIIMVLRIYCINKVASNLICVLFSGLTRAFQDMPAGRPTN
jgi:hypothetical protein